MPGFLILHYLPKFAQTHVYWVDDAIQPSHLLSSPSPPALNLSHQQGLFQWVASDGQTLELQLQHQSFQWIFRVDFKIDLFDLLAVQGNRKRFLHNNIKSTENINAAKKWFLSFWDCKIGKYIGCQIKKKKPEITNARNESCNIAGFCRLSKDKQNIMNEFIAIIWQCRWNRHIPWLLKVTKD